MQKVKDILEELKKHSNKEAREGMARFGINTEIALGVSIPVLRKIAKENGKDHKLALELWKTRYHEARILASIVEEIEKVTEEQMEDWVKDFNSWDICDQCCLNLFDKTKYAIKKAIEWTEREEEFVKRAGFALMATMAFHRNDFSNEAFEKFMPIIKREAKDERNFVKKAVNWALRQIGKRNLKLNKVAIKTAKEIKKIDNKAARWVANDAIRELESKEVQARLKNKKV